MESLSEVLSAYGFKQHGRGMLEGYDQQWHYGGEGYNLSVSIDSSGLKNSFWIYQKFDRHIPTQRFIGRYDQIESILPPSFREILIYHMDKL